MLSQPAALHSQASPVWLVLSKHNHKSLFVLAAKTVSRCETFSSQVGGPEKASDLLSQGFFFHHKGSSDALSLFFFYILNLQTVDPFVLCGTLCKQDYWPVITAVSKSGSLRRGLCLGGEKQVLRPKQTGNGNNCLVG